MSPGETRRRQSGVVSVFSCGTESEGCQCAGVWRARTHAERLAPHRLRAVTIDNPALLAREVSYIPGKRCRKHADQAVGCLDA